MAGPRFVSLRRAERRQEFLGQRCQGTAKIAGATKNRLKDGDEYQAFCVLAAAYPIAFLSRSGSGILVGENYVAYGTSRSWASSLRTVYRINRAMRGSPVALCSSSLGI